MAAVAAQATEAQPALGQTKPLKRRRGTRHLNSAAEEDVAGVGSLTQEVMGVRSAIGGSGVQTGGCISENSGLDRTPPIGRPMTCCRVAASVEGA